MTVSDKLLRDSFDFGVTNIPVQTNDVFVYSPAVQRLLQVTANIYDATTTNPYPTVFRPLFNRDSAGNVFIVGYRLVVSVSDANDPQLAVPVKVSDLPFGVSSNVNVYGVPWILGVKKGLPNFNRFYLFNNVQVTRKLQLTRDAVVPYTVANANLFHTNEQFVLSITNHLGWAFWNSYDTNYQLGPLNVVVRDTLGMQLSNALPRVWSAATLFTTNLVITNWPGSAWSSNDQNWNNQQPATESFIYGTCDFTLLPDSIYRFSTVTFEPLANNPAWEIIPSIPPLPQFDLRTTNQLQAFILDTTANRVVDYVQFDGPNSLRDINQELKDPDSPGANPYYMWSTNVAGNNPGLTPSRGVLNQILVSRLGPTYAPAGGGWQSSPNLPSGIPPIPTTYAAYFDAFFTLNFQYANRIYTNSNLTQVAPFTPTRTLYEYTMWQVNDPLVHYLATDLKDFVLDKYRGHSDGFDAAPLPTPNTALAALDDPYGLAYSHYQPWGRNDELSYFGVLVDENRFNLADRDPLVWNADWWNFPTNQTLNSTWLGRVHRGTPWQTLFLKSTNILATTSDVFGGSVVNVGTNTWMIWTGVNNLNDLALTAPVNDWRLVSLLNDWFNTNDPTQLTSVSDLDLDHLRATLQGINVLTNTSLYPDAWTLPEFAALSLSSNSPQAWVVASAIRNAQTNQLNQGFRSTGDWLALPELTEASPWLNQSDVSQQWYGISEAAYEAIPSQLLSRIRSAAIGEVAVSDTGKTVQFSGSDAYEYQVQASTDLIHWQTLYTTNPFRGVIKFPLNVATNAPPSFFRTQLVP